MTAALIMIFTVKWHQPSLKLYSSCLLSFLGVFLIARNRPKIKQQDRNFIAMDKIPGKFEIDSPKVKCVTYSPISIEDGGLIGWH